MEIESCKKCGAVVDLKYTKEKSVYKLVDNMGQSARGFECPVCNCVNLKSEDYFFQREESKKEIIEQIGENYILNMWDN